LVHAPQHISSRFSMATVLLLLPFSCMQALIVRTHKAHRADQRDQFLGTFSHQPLHMPATPLASRRRTVLVQPTGEDSFHQLSAYGLTALDHLLFQLLQFSIGNLAHLREKGAQLLFERFAQYSS